MKKRLFLLLVSIFECFLFSITGLCEKITTYSDEIITFDYDEDFSANISFNEMSGNTHYSITTNAEDEYANGFILIAIRDLDVYKGKDLPWQDYIAPIDSCDEFTVESLSNGENREVYIKYNDPGKKPRYSKILNSSDDKFMFINYTLSEDGKCNEFLQSVYDSITLSEQFDIDNYSYPENPETTQILQNLVASD